MIAWGAHHQSYRDCTAARPPWLWSQGANCWVSGRKQTRPGDENGGGLDEVWRRGFCWLFSIHLEVYMEKLQKLLVHAAKHGPLELGGWKSTPSCFVRCVLVFFVAKQFQSTRMKSLKIPPKSIQTSDQRYPTILFRPSFCRSSCTSMLPWCQQTLTILVALLQLWNLELSNDLTQGFTKSLLFVNYL